MEKEKAPIYKNIWFWAVLILVILFIFSLAGMDKDDDDTKGDVTTAADSGTLSQTENTTSDSGNTTLENRYYAGDSVRTNTLEITFVSASTDWKEYSEYLGPTEGYKVVAAYFEIENISSTDQTVGSFEFTCYADGVAMNEFYNGNEYLSSNTISGGRKLTGYLYYEVPEKAEQIEIEYETSIWSRNKAIFIVQE